MNEYLKKALIVSASALMFLSAGASINNVQARRYHYRYHRRASHNKYGYWKHYRRHGRRHSYFVRYKTGYYHNGHWIRYHRNHGTSVTVSAGGPAEYTSKHRRRGHSRFKVHFRKISPRRHGRRYHIDVEGVNGGWTNNYNYYKLESAKIQNAINIQTAKDEEAESLNPSQSNNTGHQLHRGHSHFHVKFRKISGPSDNNTPVYHSPSLGQIRQQMINDINQDRVQNGLSPVQEDPLMEKIADERAEQATQNFTHYDANNNNTPYELEDAERLGIQFGKGDYIFTENLDADSSADDGNNDMMYNDADSGWGHRKNILYPDWKIVGVGVARFPKSSEYYGDVAFAEDFATYATKGNNNGIYSNSNVPEHNGSYDPYSWAYNHGNN